MIEIVVRENQNIEEAIRIFRRKIKKDDLMAELRRRRFYEKPSVKRRAKSRLAKRNGCNNREK